MSGSRRIRALVVADAVAARRFVAGTLSSDPDFETVSTAPNGKVALAKLLRLQPDVVTLDPALPDDGAMQTMLAIRLIHPRMPVIVFSSFVAPGHGVMRSLLAHGASACIAAATGADNAAVGWCIREELIPKTKELCARQPKRIHRIDIVAVGISTGGPDALPALLSTLPANFAVPIVIVQHMPPVFTRLLAKSLDAKCAITVSEASGGETLSPGSAWLAPGGHHLTVVSKGGLARLDINTEPQENSCRPAADPLFRSIAQLFGPSALAVVMTGMGRDGLSGSQAIHHGGGQILVQDEATSVVWGMPGAVVHAGIADAVLPLDALGPEIVRRVQIGRNHPAASTLPTHVR